VGADTRVAYCRCGASENKPFCDGRHADAGFQALGGIAEDRPDSQEISGGGKLTVNVASNGPLVLQGPVTVRSADGGDTVTRNAVSLCRCGASQKKPFCDGTHKEIGFTAE
jgi:CDGSH-type Zn-finger protein